MITEGLITRIGKWIDNKWESKATCRELEEQKVFVKGLHMDLLQTLEELRKEWLLKLGEYKADSLTADQMMQVAIGKLEGNVQHLIEIVPPDFDAAKEFAELKTRFERLELYSGMARKVDPTKPPVVKSAFSM